MNSRNRRSIQFPSRLLPLHVLRAEGFGSLPYWIQETRRCLAAGTQSSVQDVFSDRRVANWKLTGALPRLSELRRFRDLHRLPPEWLRAGLSRFYTAPEGALLPDISEANLFFELIDTPVNSKLEKDRRTALTARHLALPEQAARRFKGTQRDELINVATEEMMRAMTRYIPARGIFSRFGLASCRWGIIMYLSKQYYGELEPAVRRQYSRVGSEMRRYRTVFGKEPGEQELARSLNMTVKAVQEARQFHLSHTQRSLDAPIGDTGRTLYSGLALRYTNAD